MFERSFDEYKVSAEYIAGRAGFTPEIGIVLGSCLGPLARCIEDPVVIPYEEIPGFLRTTVRSHAGKLILGKLGGKKVVCMSGRFHYYEGYDFEQLVIPVRVLKLLGIRALILTNASGGINEDFRVGDIMLIRDHIKLFGASPLRGKNIEEFGPRFFDVTDMYTKELRDMAKQVGEKSPLTVHEGVYYYSSGPQFETPAEIKAMRILGADAVGMSTVTEALTACHCSLPILAIAVITNMAAGMQDGSALDEVDQTAKMIEEDFSRYMMDVVGAL